MNVDKPDASYTRASRKVIQGAGCVCLHDTYNINK